jgi:hypothetical protein
VLPLSHGMTPKWIPTDLDCAVLDYFVAALRV